MPIDGEVSFADLAKQCRVNVIDLRRVLCYAMYYHRLLYEPREDFVAHTLASPKLAEKPLLGDRLWLLGDRIPASNDGVTSAEIDCDCHCVSINYVPCKLL